MPKLGGKVQRRDAVFLGRVGRRAPQQQLHDRSVALTVLGSLTFLPGSYACWLLLGAWCGWSGYSYRDIPSYDEE